MFNSSPIIPPIQDDEHPELYSLIRRIEHLINFKKPPQTSKSVALPSMLLRPENANILSVLISLRANTHSFFPEVIEHWTTRSNLASILSTGMFLGARNLKKHHLGYEPNVLDATDELNLDGNVICFCPGKFVDSAAIFNYGTKGLRNHRVLVRLNSCAIKRTGKYNMFFKITDLCGPYFTQSIELNNEFKIKIIRNRQKFKGSALNVMLEFKGIKEVVGFSNHECIFYGNIHEINSFGLLLLFIFLDKCKNQDLTDQVYQYFRELDPESLSKIIVNFSKSMTRLSEFNIRGSLRLQPNLIQSIHFANKGYTYILPADNNLSEAQNIISRENSIFFQGANFLSGDLLRQLLYSSMCQPEEVVSPSFCKTDYRTLGYLYRQPIVSSKESISKKYKFSKIDLTPSTSKKECSDTPRLFSKPKSD